MASFSEMTPLVTGAVKERSVAAEHRTFDEESPKYLNGDSPNNATWTISWSESWSAISDSVRGHVGRIGLLGSMSIAVNSLTGPAMLNLPDTYQRSGFIPTTICVIFVCILSAMCCLHMANTISKVPGNYNFKKNIEYSETFEKFWGHRSFVVTQLIFFCCVTCLNVSSIVDVAQVVDTCLGHSLPGGSAAINLLWKDGTLEVDWVRWDFSLCSEQMLVDGTCLPFFETEGCVFTLGYTICLLIFIPMALMDLKENAAWQIVGFLVLLVGSVEFVYLFLTEGIHIENLSLWGTSWDTLFGVVLFNFALVIAVPAWLYEKDPDVDVPTVIHGSSGLSAVLYIFLGALGAMTMPNVSPNMLESMMSGAFGTAMQINASVFAFFIIGLGCPLFSVLTRMNLTGSGLFSRPVANILSVYLPFFSSWLFYQGDAVTQLLSWGGIVFTSVVAFILPLWISLHSLDTSDDDGVVNVYGRWNVSSRKMQKMTLKVLMVLAALAIIAAILGNLMVDSIVELYGTLRTWKS